MPQWCKLIPLNMVMVRPYFSLLTIPTNHLIFIGNMLPKVPVLSAQLNSAMCRLRKKPLPLWMPFRSLTSCSSENLGLLPTVTTNCWKQFSNAFWCLPCAPCRAWCSHLLRYLFQVEYRKGCSLLTHCGYSFSFTSVRDNTQKVHENWCTVWSVKETTQNSLVSRTPLFRKSKLKQTQILNRNLCASSLKQGGQMRKPQFLSLYIHIGLSVMN